MRRKHKTRHIVIALLLLLGVSGAAALAMLPTGYGSGNQGNFAFLPAELLSVFKKADPPSGGQPQEPRTYAGYQPGEIPDLPELPINEPVTEFVEGTVIQEAGLAPQGGTTNIPKGGPGITKTTSTPSNPGDPGVPGGNPGGISGGGSPARTMAALVVEPDEETCEGEECVAECEGEDCVAKCEGEDCVAKCEGEDCIAKCEGEDCIAQCEGTNCTTQCEGTNCTTQNNGETENAGNEGENPGSCTGPNCEDDKQNAGTCIGEDCLLPVCDEVTVSSAIPCYEPNPNDDGQQANTEPPVNVDEPGPLSLLLIGALGLALARRAKRKAQSRGTTPNA